MKYVMYKLTFPAGVHIGDGSLSRSNITVHADTFFSALCIEAINVGGTELLETLVQMTKENRFIFSDALPYICDTAYVPKPMCRVEGKEQDASLKKEFKNLAYIPADKLEEYMAGNIDPIACNTAFATLGANGLYQKVAIKPEEDNELYSVGIYKFNNSCGLYLICGFEDDETEKIVDSIMTPLQYSGIGGKRSAGYGRFSYEKTDIPFAITEGSRYMTLSVCMAADSELERVLSGASYKLLKRSGFVQSATYSAVPMKKRDFYLFTAGSVFENRFRGDIFDVSMNGRHPVYKYAKPVLLGIGG